MAPASKGIRNLTRAFGVRPLCAEWNTDGLAGSGPIVRIEMRGALL